MDYDITYFFQQTGSIWNGTRVLDGLCLDTDSTLKLISLHQPKILTGVIIAQFRGVYFFSYSATASDLYPSTVVRIMKNCQVVTSSVFNSGLNSSIKYSMHLKATLLLEAGDEVSVQDYTQEANGTLTVTQHSMKDYPNSSMLLNKTRGTLSGFMLSSFLN